MMHLQHQTQLRAAWLFEGDTLYEASAAASSSLPHQLPSRETHTAGRAPVPCQTDHAPTAASGLGIPLRAHLLQCRTPWSALCCTLQRTPQSGLPCCAR